MNSASMTVIHVIAQLRFGAGRCVVDMAVEQARGHKHNIIVCISTDADEHWRSDPKLVSELVEQGIEVHTIGDFFHRRPASIHECGRHLRTLQEDSREPFVVHAHTAMAAAAGHWARPDALIATCHGWGPGRPAEVDLQDSLAYQLCDSILTYSDHWANRLRKDMAVSNPKVLSMGVNLERFPPKVQRNLDDSTPLRIVTVCELTPRKGVDLLLNAMPVLWRHKPDVELHIMGHGDAAEDLRRQAAETDPERKRIFFYGTVANPYAQLADYDLFVLPSRSDNLPVVLLEAMLAGFPIIATAVGGVLELISASKCGKAVLPESATALAEGIVETLKLGRQEMVSIGMKGEQFVRERLDVRRTTSELETVYRQALQKQRPIGEIVG
jgi:glycosyltransferase involved in cell wall biosynthesis